MAFALSCHFHSWLFPPKTASHLPNARVFCSDFLRLAPVWWSIIHKKRDKFNRFDNINNNCNNHRYTTNWIGFIILHSTGADQNNISTHTWTLRNYCCHGHQYGTELPAAPAPPCRIPHRHHSRISHQPNRPTTTTHGGWVGGPDQVVDRKATVMKVNYSPEGKPKRIESEMN